MLTPQLPLTLFTRQRLLLFWLHIIYMPVRKIKGGKATRVSTSSASPFQQYGYPDGATSAREASISRQNTMNANQQAMIDNHGGRKRTRARGRRTRSRRARGRRTRKAPKRARTNRRRKHTRSRRGGKSTGRQVTVPQFSTTSVGPVDANSSSISNNSTSMQASADTAGDCYATNSCGQAGGSPQTWYDVWPAGSFGAPGMTGGPVYSGPRLGGKRGTRRRGGKTVWGCLSGGH